MDAACGINSLIVLKMYAVYGLESSSKVNHAQLIGFQSGEVTVKVFDRITWLLQWSRRVPSIKKGHQFVFS